jgi:hypothetical protein
MYIIGVNPGWVGRVTTPRFWIGVMVVLNVTSLAPISKRLIAQSAVPHNRKAHTVHALIHRNDRIIEISTNLE